MLIKKINLKYKYLDDFNIIMMFWQFLYLKLFYIIKKHKIDFILFFYPKCFD